MKERYRELSFYNHRVKVRIEGFRLERLLDQAMKAGIIVKGVRLHSDMEMTCMVSQADLKKLKKLGRALYRFTVIEEKGCSVGAKYFLKKPALVIGCTLAIALVIIQASFVHAIEINGYKGIPEMELRQVLEENGVYEGACKSKIDWEKAEKAVYDRFPKVTWVQLVYSGRLVILNISETTNDIYDKDVQHYAKDERKEKDGKDEKDEKDDKDDKDSAVRTYIDIVATKAGYIESVNPYYGLALVEPGDYVKKGQILITGCVPMEPTTFGEDNAREYYINAEGQVFAKVPYHFTVNQERYVWGSPAGEEGSEAGNGAGGFGVIASRVEKTREDIEKKAEQQIRLWAKENLPEKAEIVKKSLKFFPKENIIEVSVTLEVRQQIGKAQEEVIGEKTTDTQRDRQD